MHRIFILIFSCALIYSCSKDSFATKSNSSPLLFLIDFDPNADIRTTVRPWSFDGVSMIMHGDTALNDLFEDAPIGKWSFLLGITPSQKGMNTDYPYYFTGNADRYIKAGAFRLGAWMRCLNGASANLSMRLTSRTNITDTIYREVITSSSNWTWVSLSDTLDYVDSVAIHIDVRHLGSSTYDKILLDRMQLDRVY